jgi:chemotaxis response regulator CheB
LRVRKTALSSEERLRRHDQAARVKGEHRIENLIVIGASAGGHQVLVEILKDFPPGMPAAIVILLHTSLGSTLNLKASLQRFSRLPIIEVKSRESLKQGAIFIPPPGRSAAFSSGSIAVEAEVRSRPVSTINHIFTSAAKNYGERVIGVILSGLLRDGTEGLHAVHEASGLTMVQNPQEAEYPDMPANAMAGLPVTFCLNLVDIGPALELLVRRTSRFETGLAVAVRVLRDRSALLVRLGEQSWRNPGTRQFLKNELASLRRNLQAIDDLVKASSLAEHAGQNMPHKGH